MVIEIITDLLAVRWLLLFTVVAAFFYQTYFRYRTYFRDQGVPYLPGIPVIGSQWRLLCGRENMVTATNRYYNSFPDKPFFGIFEFLNTPVYVIRDPDLIKQLGVKDFDHFINHRMAVNNDNDPLLGRSLFMMRDAKWRDMRSTVSPAFTGSKMRLMLSLVSECAERFVGHLKTEVPSDGLSGKVYDLRDLFTRFSNDAIASSAFGLNVNSVKDPENEFYKTGLTVTNFSGVKALKFMLFQSIPKVMKWLRVGFFDGKETEFFRHLVHSTMTYREENNVIRHDMIHLMMEAKKGTLVHSAETDMEEKDMGFATVEESDLGKSKRIKDFEDDDLVAQCMIFFLAGFNGLSLVQCFIVHELAVNHDIQSKLYNEIADAHRGLNGKPLNYDSLQKLRYLDQVVSEALRRWPLAPVNDRSVNAPYTLHNNDGSSVQLNVGDAVVFSTYAIQMDPKYFPEPERFDPDRFSEENKDNIYPGSYLPFGIGPRNCVGSRYALMGVKAIIYHLLLNFTIERCEKTQHPLKLKESLTAAPLPEKGFWAELRPRSAL